MADIFLSYAREDRDKAALIAAALGAEGYDVFWDVEIPPGLSWADFLEEKLSVSKAAIVLWSQSSTASQWVREEARLARDRGKLIPAMLDAAAPPFGFGEIQAANLSAWRGNRDDAHWRLLLSAIERTTGRKGAPPASVQPFSAPAAGPDNTHSPPSAPPQSANTRPAPTPASAPGWRTPAPPSQIVLDQGAANQGAPSHVAPGASVHPASADGVARKSTLTRNVVLGAGVAAAIVIVAVLAGQDQDDGLGASLGIVPGAPAVAGQTPLMQLSPAVADAVASARQAQTEAAAAVNEAMQATAQANQAVANAQNGVMGHGQAPLNPTTLVIGDLASLAAGRPAAVTMRSAAETFAGVIQAEVGTGRFLRTAGSSQNAQGAASGVMTFSGARGTFLGRSTTQAYNGEGRTDGVVGSFEGTGVGVFQFADGTRYEGQFRALGADGHVVKQGYGAYYDRAGALAQAGRFENDVYAGAQ